MKKTGFLKKTAAAALACVLALGASAITAFAANDSAEVNSDSLRLVVHPDSYSIYTTSGQQLIYSFSSGNGTSATYLSVDGRIDEVSGEVVKLSDKSAMIKQTEGDIKVDYTLSITKNPSTGKEDIVEFKLEVKNNGEVPHAVGSRIMLDTRLGRNDEAPFRVSGYGEVTQQIQFAGDSVPYIYQAFDDLAKPVIVSTGSFLQGAGKPDAVQFNRWGNSLSNDLYPSIELGKDIGDSSVNAIWDEKELDPGSSFVYTIYYGLSHIEVNANSNLVVGASKIENSFEVNEEGTGYKPVSLIAYLKNSGDVMLNDAELSFELPNGVTIANGGAKYDYPTVAVGKTEQKTVTLIAEPASNERTVTVRVKAKSAETGEVEPVEITYFIPAINGAEVIEDTTVPATQEPSTEAPSTEAPTTEEPSTNQSAAEALTTQATVAPSTAAADATPSQATPSQTNNAVKTGAALPVFAILAVLISAFAGVYFIRRRSNG